MQYAYDDPDGNTFVMSFGENQSTSVIHDLGHQANVLKTNNDSRVQIVVYANGRRCQSRKIRFDSTPANRAVLQEARSQADQAT